MMRTLLAVKGKSLVQLLEDGEVLAAVYDYTLHHLITNGFAPTVERYLQLDTLGDAASLEDVDSDGDPLVGPENRAEIERLVEIGFLIDVRGRVN
jgi:hypothetical protein